MQIETYNGRYDDQIVALILGIQNEEMGVNLSLEEQPDLMDIGGAYQQNGGEFWLALEGETVVGTLGLMRKNDRCAVLKKFFIRSDHRARRVGLALYQRLLAFAQKEGLEHIILDTPAVAHAAHRFYERAGFRKIQAEELPVHYTYPDRDCMLYMLDL